MAIQPAPALTPNLKTRKRPVLHWFVRILLALLGAFLGCVVGAVLVLRIFFAANPNATGGGSGFVFLGLMVLLILGTLLTSIPGALIGGMIGERIARAKGGTDSASWWGHLGAIGLSFLAGILWEIIPFTYLALS